MKLIVASRILLVTACLVLAGCGGGKKEDEANNAYRGIFVSTNDCATDDKLTLDICTTAITAAIEYHNQNSPSYETLRACAATEAGANCERDVNHKFRPRLIAYLVEATEPPSGTPLYSNPKEKGFRDAVNRMYLATDLTVTFSKRAVAAFAKK